MIISVKLAPETLFLVHKVLLDEIQTKPADTRAKKALKSILIELFNVFVKKCISYGSSPNGKSRTVNLKYYQADKLCDILCSLLQSTSFGMNEYNKLDMLKNELHQKLL